MKENTKAVLGIAIMTSLCLLEMIIGSFYKNPQTFPIYIVYLIVFFAAISVAAWAFAFFALYLEYQESKNIEVLEISKPQEKTV
jgi:hypothetical protein